MNRITGTVPASLSALTNLDFLCAGPAHSCSLCAGTRAGRMHAAAGSRGVRRRRGSARGDADARLRRRCSADY
jgi:hypothetical protein